MQSTAALPFTTIAVVVALWALLMIPLAVVGASLAWRRGAAAYDAPCKTNATPRAIPGVPWYQHGMMQLLVAGALPFSGIYMELYYICTSVSGGAGRWVARARGASTSVRIPPPRLPPGAPIVLVLTASSHRAAALDSCAFLIDWLKTRAPFWKREEFAGGAERWVDAKAGDDAAAARWDPA